MKIFSKLIDSAHIQMAPKNLGNIINYNSPDNIEQLNKDGYYETIISQPPSSGYVTRYKKDGNKIYAYFEERDIEAYKQDKISEIRYASKVEASHTEKYFSEPEQKTWGKQETGARLLKENPESTDSNAIFVKNIASAIGIDVSVLVEKILSNTAYADNVASKIIGYQNRLEGAINAAVSIEELDQIVWNFENSAENNA